MDWKQALTAGIIQGSSEFLPVSSSGHLIIFNELYGESGGADLAFTVFLHLATLLAVLIMFRKDFFSLVKEFSLFCADIFKGRFTIKTPERKFLIMVIIGTIPAALVGVLIKILRFDAALNNIFVAAVMFVVTAALMFAMDKIKEGAHTERGAPYTAALLTGAMQAAAILPGLSRSGATMFGARVGGMTRESSVKFAFILSAPVILGAGLVEGMGLAKDGAGAVDPASWLIGFIAAFLCGMLAIRLIKYLAVKNKFFVFGIYCLLASAAAFLAGFGVIGA